MSNQATKTSARTQPSLVMSARARGRWVWLLYAVHRVMSILSGGRAGLQAYQFCAQPIDPVRHRSLRDDPNTMVQTVTPGSPLLEHFPRPPDVLAQRFAECASCHAIIVKGEFAGYLWLSRDAHDEDEVRCRYLLPMTAPSVWDFDVYIAPRFRAGRGLARLWKAVSAELYTQGVRWSYSRISLFNLASVQAHERLGALPVATGLFVHIGPLQLSIISKAPYLHVGVRPKHRPVLKLPMPAAAAASGKRPSGAAGRPAQGGAAAMVLGLDSHGLAVARALADAGVSVCAMCLGSPLPGAFSNRVKRTFPVPTLNEDSLVPALLAARQQLPQHDRVALIAVNDRQVGIIAKHLELLQPHYRIAWADRAATILELQLKDSLEARCRQQGLSHPRSITFASASDAANAANFRYPVIIKPVQPLSSFKTLLARDVAELEQLLQAKAQALPVLGQEYIEGDDSRLFFGALMLDHGRVVHGMVGRKIASFPPARGQTTIAETVNEPEVLRLTEQFFAGLALSGPVSLELKRDNDGGYWVIEPTVGRTDFWAELCISAGFNQPLMEFQLAVELPITPAQPQQGSVWYDTERDPLAYVGLCWRERTMRPRGKVPVFPYNGHRDAKPARKAWQALLHRYLMRVLPGLQLRPHLKQQTPARPP